MEKNINKEVYEKSKGEVEMVRKKKKKGQDSFQEDIWIWFT